MKNKLRIRFKGFTEDWEQHKFNDIVFKQSKISETELPYVEFEDINSGIGTLNKDISQKTGHKKGILFEAGDILFGKLRPYLQNWLLCEFDGIAVGDFWVLRPQSITSKFLYYLIQSEAYQSVANISSGTKMPRSNWTLVSETSFSIPKYEESRMIGEFFSFIDKTITLHQRKLEKLKLAKKALLQKLFPKNGSQFPEIRFKGFTDAWEQRKLGSILIEYIEKNPGNEHLPVLTSSRQGLTKQEDHFGSVQRHDISDYNVIPLGFCTYRNRSDDKTFTFNINRIVPRGLVSKFYPVFDINNGNADFVTEYLNNNIGIIKSLAVNAVGTSQVVLSFRTLKNIEVILPSKAEQVAIGNYIKKLNICITLHQRKLDKLQDVKKGLLQKMFV